MKPRAEARHEVAPPARIIRNGESQLHHLPRLLREAEHLERGARADAGPLIRERLGALSASLLRSPYYASKLAARGLSPRDLDSLEALSHFPVLERSELARHWSEFPVLDDIEQDERHRELVVVQSSGTTGEPVKVVRDGYDCLHMWAALRFWLRRLRLELPERPRVVLFCALPGGLEYSVRLPCFERGALHRISAVKPKPFERLARVKPSVLFSDPAGLHALADRSREVAPRLVLTSAQHFSPIQRRALANAFDAPVLNYYATTETGPIAWECLEHLERFHVMAPDVHVESERGELRVTRLRPSVLPLLRYAPGDRGEVVDEACSCGFVGRSIVHFGGRRACVFVTPNGNEVDAWSLAFVFKHHPLDAFRLTQESAEHFSLELVGLPEIERARLIERLRAAMQHLGWERFHLSTRDVGRATLQLVKPEPFVARETSQVSEPNAISR